MDFCCVKLNFNVGNLVVLRDFVTLQPKVTNMISKQEVQKALKDKEE